MRSISRKAVETMKSRRDFYASAEITFADGTEKTLGKSDFTLSGNSIIDSAESNSFPLGVLASKRVTLSLMNDDDRWSEYDFYGAKIYLETKYDLDDGTTESFAIGTFTVVTPESYGTVISVTAMDDSYKTDKAYATSLSYPMSMGIALRDSCSSCGITLIGEVPNSDYVIPSAPTDLTHRQFIGMCAMIAGGNAKFDERNRLLIVPYDFSAFEKLNLWDGGSFKPWTEGEEKDGGTFSPWTTGEVADGGTFGDRDNIHVLHEFATGMTLEVDDVVITGVQMESEDEDGKAKTHLYGSEGYVLSLENQLAKGTEDAALALIGKKIVGLRFRPFSGNHISLPTAEFMDLAMIVDWKQNVYQTVLTDVTFNYFGFTALKCAADSPIRNSSKRYGSETKAIIQARQMVEREKTEREKAVEILADELANSNGLYMTEERQDDGSTIYYMHDKPTKGESKVVWKLTANAFGVSTDGGKTYPYGLDATGMAILDRIYAIGLDADYIKTGAIEISKNGKQMVLMDYDTGQVIIRPDTFELSSGATIESIAEGKANSALENAKSYTDTTAQSTLQSANGYADTAASNAVNGQTQRDIFNKLTNGGKNSGIYLDGTNLYVNADYINSGIIEVLDEYGNPIFSVNKDTGRVVIDGETLLNGSVNAVKINVEDLFARTIKASGTIEGVTLKGTKGEIGGFTIGETSLDGEKVMLHSGSSGSSGYVEVTAANTSYRAVTRVEGNGVYIDDGELSRLSYGGGYLHNYKYYGELELGYIDQMQSNRHETMLTLTGEGNIDAKGDIKASGSLYEGGQLISSKYAVKEDSGWRGGGICRYRKKNGWVELEVYSTSFTVTTSYTTLITLPTGYRPSQTIYTSGVDASGTVGTVLYVSANGMVGIKAAKEIGTAMAHITFVPD